MPQETQHSASLVKVEHLSRRYGDNLAVNDVSFNLDKGEVLGFLGPNGAGKSTSMQIISGNLAPTTGQIQINGFDIIDNPIEAKSSIGYLPEHPPIYRDLTVDEYLTYCARLHRIASRDIRTALDDAKQHCGLEQVGQRLIGNLSKGFQQRVGIAQAIIHRPLLVILDEPTVGLDPIQIREIRHLIKTLGQEHSVILSTHILPEVQATCDRVQIIRRGELVYHASIEELNARGTGTQLTMALRKPPSLDQLQQIAGCLKASQVDHHRFHIQFEGDDFAEMLGRHAVENHWGLFELIPDNTSLEEIFVELTTNEVMEEPTGEEHAA